MWWPHHYLAGVCFSGWSMILTCGQRLANCLLLTRRRYCSTVTRRGLRRQTIPNRSSRPHGATTWMRSPPRRRTATAVAVSGQVATPSAEEVSGATCTPNTFGYHRWTAAWLVTSQQVSGACSLTSRCTRRSRSLPSDTGSKNTRSRSRDAGAGVNPCRWSHTRSRRAPRRSANQGDRPLARRVTRASTPANCAPARSAAPRDPLGAHVPPASLKLYDRSALGPVIIRH